MHSLKVMGTYPAVSVTEPVDGVFVVDFGINLSGYCTISAIGTWQ